MNNNFHIRQAGLINVMNITQSVGIIGAGSIGSWTTLALSKLGCPDLTVYDFDAVEEQNVGPQLYTSRDIGKAKVVALKERLQILLEKDPDIFNIKVDENTEAIRKHDVIIMGLDTIEARRNVFENLSKIHKPNAWLIDGRMEANEIQIFAFQLNDTEATQKYVKTLFNEASVTPVACSMRSVVYNCFIVAGLITDIFSRIVNEDPVPFNLEVDLKNFALYGGLLS